jgi:hypothetical protein
VSIARRPLTQPYDYPNYHKDVVFVCVDENLFDFNVNVGEVKVLFIWVTNWVGVGLEANSRLHCGTWTQYLSVHRTLAPHMKSLARRKSSVPRGDAYYAYGGGRDGYMRRGV